MALDNTDTINGKIDYGLALFGGPKEVKKNRTRKSPKAGGQEIKKSRQPVNITMVDKTKMAIRTKAIKMGVKTWTLIDDALNEYINSYDKLSKEDRASRHQEVKNSGKGRHPANFTMAIDTKKAIALIAAKENEFVWVIIEEALSAFLG